MNTSLRLDISTLVRSPAGILLEMMHDGSFLENTLTEEQYDCQLHGGKEHILIVFLSQNELETWLTVIDTTFGALPENWPERVLDFVRHVRKCVERQFSE